MSYTSIIKDYVRTKFSAYDSELVEWSGIFDLDNIPRNLKNKSYFIQISRVTSESLDDLMIKDKATVDIFLFLRAMRNEGLVKDNSINLAHNLRRQLVGVINQTNLKNIIFDTMEIDDRLGDDNSIILSMSFTMELIF